MRENSKWLRCVGLLVLLGCGDEPFRVGAPGWAPDDGSGPDGRAQDVGGADADEDGSAGSGAPASDDADDAGEATDAARDAAARTDAGAVDVGAPDGGALPDPDGSAPFPLAGLLVCSGVTGALACDDFDGSRAGAALVTVLEDGTLDRADGHVKADTSSTDQRAIVQASFPVLWSGSVYLRFALYVPSSVVISGLNVATLGDPNSPSDFGLDLNLVRGGEVELVGTGGNYVVDGGSYVVPRDRWMCVLLEVNNISRVRGAAGVVIDGQQVLAVADVDTQPPVGVVGAAAGIDWTYQDQGAATVYVDNVLVSTSPPGPCP